MMHMVMNFLVTVLEITDLFILASQGLFYFLLYLSLLFRVYKVIDLKSWLTKTDRGSEERILLFEAVIISLSACMTI